MFKYATFVIYIYLLLYRSFLFCSLVDKGEEGGSWCNDNVSLQPIGHGFKFATYRSWVQVAEKKPLCQG